MAGGGGSHSCWAHCSHLYCKQKSGIDSFVLSILQQAIYSYDKQSITQLGMQSLPFWRDLKYQAPKKKAP